MKRIWYHIVKIYITTGLFFYHKKITVFGKENIPKKGAILFVSNHKNALIDPLLIATTTTRNIHFLTRASAFKIKLVKWLLSTVNMLPIYRIRDGKETLAKNEEIFKKCYDLFNKGRSLLIFPEGTHDIRRWVRPLSKGFTRITFGALEQNPDLKLTIVPIGLNYSKAEDFAESVSIYYGKPIAVNPFLENQNKNVATLALKHEVSSKMKELTTHVDDIKNYDSIINKLGSINYLEPKAVNEKLKSIDEFENSFVKTRKPNPIWRIGYLLVLVNSIIPFMIWKAIKPSIKEIEFNSTTRFAVGITAFPLFYLIQTLVVSNFFGGKIALIYLTFTIVIVLILTKNK